VDDRSTCFTISCDKKPKGSIPQKLKKPMYNVRGTKNSMSYKVIVIIKYK